MPNSEDEPYGPTPWEDREPPTYDMADEANLEDWLYHRHYFRDIAEFHN